MAGTLAGVITPDTISLAPNCSDNSRITANYANGNSEDITSATPSSVYAIFDSGDAVLTLNDGFQLGTISSTGDTGVGTYRVVISGGFTSMAFIANLFTVTVAD